MRQAITTKFICPTNTKGPRVSAKAEAGRLILAWDHSLGVEGNHQAAAEALAKRLGWSGDWVGGGLPGAGYVFTCIDGIDFHVGGA